MNIKKSNVRLCCFLLIIICLCIEFYLIVYGLGISVRFGLLFIFFMIAILYSFNSNRNTSSKIINNFKKTKKIAFDIEIIDKKEMRI